MSRELIERERHRFGRPPVLLVSMQNHPDEKHAELKMKKFDEIPAGMSLPAVFSCGENQRDLLARISLPMQHSLHFLGLLDFFLAGVEITSRDGFSS